jgi:hypothetical protein
MKQVYIQNNLDEGKSLSHEYDLQKEPIGTSLKYSNAGGWSDDLVGKPAAFLFDTGDDIQVRVGSKKLTFDYSEAMQLFCILFSWNESKVEIRESKTIKSTT